jgi:WXXGXW repeat (2 copies)
MSAKFLRRTLAVAILAALPLMASAQISVSVNIAPPELPVYDLPPLPGDGYVWTPGYWAWDEDSQDYYWVPGTWVEAPESGFLWTPGYWGFVNGAYAWNAGYWGPHVGFYGGVNYGYGYGGVGYQGGYWQGGHIFYNRAVVNVNNAHVTNVYNRTVINNVTVNRVSFNGGNGGTRARPTSVEEAAARDRHLEPTGPQRQHFQEARSTPSLRASQNHGKPPVAATERPGQFKEGGVVGARQAGAINRPAGEHPGAGPQTPGSQDHANPAAHNEPATPRNEPRTVSPRVSQPERRTEPGEAQHQPERRTEPREAQHPPVQQPERRVEPRETPHPQPQQPEQRVQPREAPHPQVQQPQRPTPPAPHPATPPREAAQPREAAPPREAPRPQQVEPRREAVQNAAPRPSPPPRAEPHPPQHAAEKP